jgi:putative ABC transport system permease protein
MKTMIKLAWRNIWRNRRRTLITATSILFAVMLSTFMMALQKGAWDKMVDNVVNFYYGYAQVHSDGYWEDQSIDKAFLLQEDLIQLGAELDELEQVVPRLESFALASSGNQTSGVLVVGTDPAAEASMTQLQDRLVDGEYFKNEEAATIIGAGVGERLKLDVGDTLVLISQGYHGVNAAGKYPVRGIVKFGSPELNKQMVYLPLKTAQVFYGAEGLVTSLALEVSRRDEVPRLIKTLKAKLPAEEYEVMGWEELLPDLVEAREIDTAGNYLIMVILYLIIAFGIFGTILMMTKEREYEFGVLLSIGMNRWFLSFTVWLEIMFLGIIGAIAGVIVTTPLVYYFYVNPLNFEEMAEDMSSAYERFGFEPIFPAAFEPSVFLDQVIVVLLLTLVLGIYPLLKIRKMKPIDAMRA